MNAEAKVIGSYLGGLDLHGSSKGECATCNGCAGAQVAPFSTEETEPYQKKK